MNSKFRIAALVLIWAIWFLAFLVRARRNKQRAQTLDPRARWGIVLEGAAFFLMLLHGPATWASPLSPLRFCLGLLFGLLAISFGWTAVANLGRQWRVDAGLNADHKLVTSGPYRIVRHPIYFSMFAMLLAALSFVGTWPLWPVALVLFAAGTEIRVRIEDGLLRQRFGDSFSEWQRSVSAWIPLLH